ncbi:monocarboxylate transporter 7-like [Acanthaster planci]|uniref:Monocarboxylate transporter 7-like n=1 Tax=Acanthaster planci TaxID=133434 RepID=A0A8B7ZNQ1_ACAPL|nr:monocarboxylate transporter 7-like [Acanthaster planci]
MAFLSSNTRIGRPATPSPGNVLDGGWTIVIAVASFLVLFLISTMTRCTGILFVSWQIVFDSTALQTGVISSIISSTSFFGSALSGVVCNRYGYRFTCILGGFLMSFAMLMVFWASKLIHMYSLGVFIDYFQTHYAIVSGFYTAGVSTKLQMIYSCVAIFLVPRAQFCGVNELQASFLLSIFGFGSLGGRVASGFFVTRKTPVEAVYTSCFVLCCVGLLCCQAETYESFAASACIVGIGIGAVEPLHNVILRNLLGQPRVASGQAINLIFGGVGDLIGPVVAGKSNNE